MQVETIITHRVGGKITEQDRHSQEWPIMAFYDFLIEKKEDGYKIDHSENRFGVSVLATRRDGDRETMIELIHYK